jgi:exopolyphosphatase/guanosine-5'-triphosphate,3'-diphosphate pyrophosphatase
VAELLRTLAALPLAERRRVPGLEPARAPVIVGGAGIVLAVLDAVGASAMTVSERDLLDGAALNADALARPVDPGAAPEVVRAAIPA